MSTATGILLVALIAALDWPKELVWNFFLFAALMFLFDLVFLLFTRNYRYRDGGCAEVGDSLISGSTEDGYELEELVSVDVSNKTDTEPDDTVVVEEALNSPEDASSDPAEELGPDDGLREMVAEEDADDLDDMSLLE
jgi:hypothetical protein